MRTEQSISDVPRDGHPPAPHGAGPSGPAQAGAPVAGAPYTSGALLARNTMLNLLGQGAPLIVALFAVPLLDEGLGTERYGLLLIAWMFLGYFSLFDLGLGRALTQLLAEKLGQDRAEEIPPLAWTALALTLVLGLLGGLVLAGLAPWIAYSALSDLSAATREDCLYALYSLAASVPVVISTASLRGILEAKQRFDIINAIRIPMGAFTFAGPLLVLPFTRSLTAVVLVLVLGRLLAWIAHVYYCLQAVPSMRRRITFSWTLTRPLLRFGGWMTVSNIISPLMVYMDRFLIGALLSATAVAYYATSWEVVTKLMMIPAALIGVLFPTFSYWQHRDARQMQQLYHTGLKVVFLALFPLVLLAVAFAEPALAWWMGPAYAEQGYRPMQILAIGVLVNGVAGVPFVLIQGLGRPELTARLHAIELPVYLALLAGLLWAYGIAGVALAWLLRAALDFVLLVAAGRRLLPAGTTDLRRLLLALTTAVLALGLLMLLDRPALLAGGAVLLLVLHALTGWRHLLSQAERSFLQQLLGRYLPLGAR